MRVTRWIGCALLVLAISAPAFGRQTEVVVRVLSQDAKFIGDQTGGAKVTLREARSGKVLAQGKTAGGTGDTEMIMEAKGRAPARHTPDAAAFIARIEIDQPTLVELEVEAPMGRPQSMTKITSQRWIMPGESVSAGDGWLIEMPGLAITPTVTTVQGSTSVEARVELMCGCPITPGGTWDAADYRVTASVWEGSRQLSSVELAFSASPGIYRGEIPGSLPPDARLIIFARNVKTANSGLVQITP